MTNSNIEVLLLSSSSDSESDSESEVFDEKDDLRDLIKVANKIGLNSKVEQLIDNEIEKRLVDGDEYELIVTL